MTGASKVTDHYNQAYPEPEQRPIRTDHGKGIQLIPGKVYGRQKQVYDRQRTVNTNCLITPLVTDVRKVGYDYMIARK